MTSAKARVEDTTTDAAAAEPLELHAALVRYADAVSTDSDLPRERMDAVYAFQRRRLLMRHGEHPVLEYFARYMMGRIDLGGLEVQPEKSAKRIKRLLGEAPVAAGAIEYAALTFDLDRAVASQLDGPSLTPRRYVSAYRTVGRLADRRRQLGLVAFVADELSGVPQSKLAYSAFKLAKRPARAAGFGAFYDLVGAGFDAVRAEPQAEAYIGEWLAVEQALLHRLLG